MARSPSGINRSTFFNGAAIIARQLRPYKKILIWLSVFGLLNATAQAFVPLVSGKIFDAIITISQNRAAVLMPFIDLLMIWTALQLVSNFISWWSGFQNDKLSTFLQAEYTAEGFAKLFEMPLAFHTMQKQGDTSDRITRAANWMDQIVGNSLLTLLPSFLSIGVALIITYFINWQLTLVLLAAIVVYAGILWSAVPRLSGLQKRMHRAWNRAYGDAHDALGNIREIKQAATEKQERTKIRRNFIHRAAQFWVDLNTIFARLTFAQKMLVSLTQLAIFVISIFFVRNGTLTPGGLVAFNGYAAMILGPFVLLGQQWQTIQNGLVAIVRADKLLSQPVEIYTPTGGISLTTIKGDVEFKDVRFAYKSNIETLKGISFHARPGQKIALVGESGVGKTTIIDLLSGFYFPQKGHILIDGVDIKKINLKDYRSRVGIVPQEPTLFNDTIEANIRYGNPGKTYDEMVAACRDAYAQDFIEAFPKKYRTIVGWRGVKLSIGQKQRIALARAFLRNPDILVLDEPTSALDAKSEQLIKTSLEKLMAGRTTFIIAHRLSTVREVDLILVLKNGEIVEQGNHAMLMQQPGGVYRGLYEMQTGFGG
ncbi:MAG TPA: ABC transporter ATP-binding protein [Candidatus Paceibacterota bacterium]|nr:ABC transporter ATP-binding protein [Candidatus Paceibacterota bacterium]